jgi:ribonuclease HI
MANASAIKLEWAGLERVDSTVGELFGALMAVTAASATPELCAQPVTVKLDNKGVVEHYRATKAGMDTRARRQVTQHARGWWNMLQAAVAARGGAVALEWLRARHNQISTEANRDGEGNERVDERAREALDREEACWHKQYVRDREGWHRDDTGQGKRVSTAWPIRWDGSEAVGAPWPLGEVEVAVYLQTGGQRGRERQRPRQRQRERQRQR